MIGEEFSIFEFDVSAVTVPEISTVEANFRTAIAEDAEMNAFGGWFDTDFRGSTADPCPRPVTLTT